MQPFRAAGLLSSSISLVADAANNLTDAASSIVTLTGFRLAARKADSRLPFGHGRMDYLCGMAVSLLMLLSGAELVQQSVLRIITPSEISFSIAACMIPVCSILIKYLMMRMYHFFDVQTQSSALHSAAPDSRNDCIASLAVLVSMLIYYLTGLHTDGFCGLAVAIFIMITGLKSLSETATPLPGAEPDPSVASQIVTIVTSADGVPGMHDLVIHDYGHGTGMVTLHVETDASSSLKNAHALADRLERKSRNH